MKTGNTLLLSRPTHWPYNASMEPGHEDREYQDKREKQSPTKTPQWSPVMKTGNTRSP